jgi:ankyrin repeat protein
MSLDNSGKRTRSCVHFSLLPEYLLMKILMCLDLQCRLNVMTTTKSINHNDELWKIVSHFEFPQSTNTKASSRMTRRTSSAKRIFMELMKSRKLSIIQSSYQLGNFFRQRIDSVAKLKSFLPIHFPVNKKFNAFDDGTILNMVSRECLWRCVKYLIFERHADYNIQDCQGMTPLLEAAWNGHISTVKYLLSLQNPPVDIHAQGCSWKTSVCGGRGPYTAMEWVNRKKNVCPENRNYELVLKLFRKLQS